MRMLPAATADVTKNRFEPAVENPPTLEGQTAPKPLSHLRGAALLQNAPLKRSTLGSPMQEVHSHDQKENPRDHVQSVTGINK